MQTSAATPAGIRETTIVPPQAQDSPLAELGTAMRMAESADRAIDGAASIAAAPAAALFQPAVPQRRLALSPAVCVCPRCYSASMVPSRRETIPVKVLRLFGIVRFRCRSCGKRTWWL